MSEDKKQSSVVENLQNLQELDAVREDLLRRQAVLQSQHDQAVKSIEILRKEMSDHGTSPEKIDADLSDARQELNQAMSGYQSKLDVARGKIEKAEAALK